MLHHSHIACLKMHSHLPKTVIKTYTNVSFCLDVICYKLLFLFPNLQTFLKEKMMYKYTLHTGIGKVKMKWVHTTPVDRIKYFVINNNGNACIETFSHAVMTNIFVGNPSRTRVKCMLWRYEWGIKNLFAPTVNALDMMTTVLFNTMVLPNELGILKQNIVKYVREVIKLLSDGLMMYGCKHPPNKNFENFNMKEEEFVEYCLETITSIQNIQLELSEAI